MTVVFYEGLVFLVVDFKHYSSIGKLGELNGLLQEADSSLLESDSADSVINNSFDLNFLSAHRDKCLLSEVVVLFINNNLCSNTSINKLLAT